MVALGFMLTVIFGYKKFSVLMVNNVIERKKIFFEFFLIVAFVCFCLKIARLKMKLGYLWKSEEEKKS